MSLSFIESLLHAVNDVTPLGLCALLSVIIFLMVNKRGPLKKLTNNHLTHTNDTLIRIAEGVERQETSLTEIRDSMNWVKGRLS